MGYSLFEQEDRLLKHCEVNKIKVKGIFREDFSAKDFNRPEWKNFINAIKKNKHRPAENIVMLAVYLSIPEAENNRRGMNTSDEMRRAREMGRWPAKAPIGYMNQVNGDGKKIIVPKQPEADYIRWSFE